MCRGYRSARRDNTSSTPAAVFELHVLPAWITLATGTRIIPFCAIKQFAYAIRLLSEIRCAKGRNAKREFGLSAIITDAPIALRNDVHTEYRIVAHFTFAIPHS